MNLFSKTTPLAVASLLAAATAFGDDKCRPQKSYEQNQQMTQAQMMPGYDAPARIDVRGSWDFFVDGSFIYWQMLQDNMEVAFVDSQLNASNYVTGNLGQVSGNFVQTDFQYKPGFKVAIGMDFDVDNWDSRAEYTMLHGQVSTATNGLLGGANNDTQLPIFLAHGIRTIMSDNAYSSVSNAWRVNLDIGDIDVGRSYHVGTNLSFRTAMGARCAWIRQSSQTTAVNSNFTQAGAYNVPAETQGTLSVSDRTHSWAVGPRVKVDTNWLIGQGIRFYGNAGADILYTKYHLQRKSRFNPTATTNGYTVDTPVADTGSSRPIALRTHMDLELGLGWGSYFDNNNWHIDLSAGYGFQVFFNQNMFQNYAALTNSPGLASTSNGNLYAQGLTATMRLDF